VELYNLIQLVAATGEEPEGIAALGIDPLAILAQAATFLLLFFLIKKYALSSIVDTLEKRRKTIDDGVRLGREMESEKERLQQTIADEIHKARLQSDEIIATTKEESAVMIRQAETTAQDKAEGIIRDAHAKIEEDISKARAGLEKDIRELVADATAVILEEKIDAKKDAGLIERALTSVRGA